MNKKFLIIKLGFGIALLLFSTVAANAAFLGHGIFLD